LQFTTDKLVNHGAIQGDRFATQCLVWQTLLARFQPNADKCENKCDKHSSPNMAMASLFRCHCRAAAVLKTGLHLHHQHGMALIVWDRPLATPLGLLRTGSAIDFVPVQSSRAQHSTTQHSTAQHSRAQCSSVQYSMVQYSKSGQVLARQAAGLYRQRIKVCVHGATVVKPE
jgi:hypothetical protein